MSYAVLGKYMGLFAGIFAGGVAVVLLMYVLSMPLENAPMRAEAQIGERTAISGVYVTPVLLIEDSRCLDIETCPDFGSVRLRARFEADLISKETVVELKRPVLFEGRLIVLDNVYKSEESIKGGEAGMDDYRFVFDSK
jgi:hypothetical protein